MTLTITSTAELVQVNSKTTVRLWNGITDEGETCDVYVLSVVPHTPSLRTQLEASFVKTRCLTEVDQ